MNKFKPIARREAINIIETPLKGLKVIETNKIADERGSFSRLFCQESLSSLLPGKGVVQINFSSTLNKGAIRGLHFQKPPAMESKFIRCLKGKVFDVAVDLRSNSPTFLHSYAQILTPENAKMMLIPEGFAHGFQVLEANSELLYLHSEFYQPKLECGLLFDDPYLAINWPLECTDISNRDRSHLAIDMNFEGVKA